MTLVKKIIKYIDGSDYETLITKPDAFWTFITKNDSVFAVNLHPTISTVELNASPRLVLKLMKVL